MGGGGESDVLRGIERAPSAPVWRGNGNGNGNSNGNGNDNGNGGGGVSLQPFFW